MNKKKGWLCMEENMFSQIDFGPLEKYLLDDDVTDVSYSNGGQLWIKTLSKAAVQLGEKRVCSYTKNLCSYNS